MGIISDFQELNREIKEYDRNTSIFHLVSKIKCQRQKAKLLKMIDKLRVANTPLPKDEILELATSVYANCIPDGIYKNIKVTYYGKSNLYRIFVDVNKDFGDRRLISSLIDVSANEKTIHITVSSEDLKTEIAHGISVTSKDFSTNIKEAKSDVEYVNSILINVMADYILDNIKYKIC